MWHKYFVKYRAAYGNDAFTATRASVAAAASGGAFGQCRSAAENPKCANRKSAPEAANLRALQQALSLSE
jgi:hypothetical protein